MRACALAGPVKHPDRAIQKVVRTYIRDAACLTDLVRSTLVFTDITVLNSFMEMVMERTAIGLDSPASQNPEVLFRLTHSKNRFEPGYDAKEPERRTQRPVNEPAGGVVL